MSRETLMINCADSNIQDQITAERLSGDALQEQIDHFKKLECACMVLDSIPVSSLMLNSCRQVVYANQAFCDFVGQDKAQFLGKRLGEIIKCEHSGLEPDGCGMSEYCKVCDALNSMMGTILLNKNCEDECRVTTQDLQAFEMQVTTTPYPTEMGQFVFTCLKDISEEKRKELLERTFLHDLLNTVGGMRGIVELLAEGEGSREFSDLVVTLTDEIIDEIKMHQLLYSAEKGETELKYQVLQSDEVLKKLEPVFMHRKIALHRSLKLVNVGEPFELESDEVLLNRVLINLVKNAFEASSHGMIVAASVRKENGYAVFQVQNNTYIDRKVQLQIFKRSFSTKGRGRGIGTYSMRLITEKYLKGSIGFESSEDTGTTFTVRLPLFPKEN